MYVYMYKHTVLFIDIGDGFLKGNTILTDHQTQTVTAVYAYHFTEKHIKTSNMSILLKSDF